MFNPRKMALYYLRMVALLGPILLVLLALGAAAEWLALQCKEARCLPVFWQLWPSKWPEWSLPVATAACGLLLVWIMLNILAGLAGDFVRAVFGLRTAEEGSAFVMRRLFGMAAFKPWARISEGKMEGDARDPLRRVGGPGNLVVYNDSGVVLEKGGKLTRVVKVKEGRGFIALDNFEKVWDVIDLRPQHWTYPVGAMSKEGIPVTCQADVTFQIDDGGQKPSGKEAFPATEQAIFLASTRKLIRETDRSEDDQIFDWARRAVIGTAEGALRSILATYLLDQLLGPSELNRGHYRAEILEKLRVRLSNDLPGLGLKLIKVELGDIKVTDEIIQQQIEAWQAWWRHWAREREAEGEAARLQAVEAAKAQAQADMIVAITQAFQSSTEAEPVVTQQLVLLRMFEVLKRAPFDPQTGILFWPEEVIKTWQRVQDIVAGRPALPEAKESEG